MDRIMTPNEAARLLHGEKATKAQADSIRRQCADGTIRNCEKQGVRWHINATREWPHLAGGCEPPKAEEPRRAVITADMTVEEMLGAIAALA